MEQIEGAGKLRKRLDNMSDGEKFLAMLQTKVTRAAQANTRPFRKTGNLGRTIKPGYLTDREATVVVGAKYGVYVEKGTGIYGPKKKPITPRPGKKALAFHSQKAGAERFGIKYRLTGKMTAASEKKYGPGADFVVVKSVKGRPATPFLGPAVTEVGRQHGVLVDIGVELWNEGT
jgi:hypothetical protein